MSTDHSRGFGTRAIDHATRSPVVRQPGNSVPIYQSVTFVSEDAAELGDILADRQRGYAYARSDNPTAGALGDAFAALHGAEAGFVFASGMAAIHAALVSQLRAGDRVVATRALYGSTRTLLSSVLARFGVAIDYVSATDPGAMEAALEQPTRVLYLETIANPTLEVADLAHLAELGHRAGATVIVDNTFASPYLCRPIELGVDLVVESLTKWVGGHSDVLAGGVVGSAAHIAQVRETEIETGGMIAPFAAFLVLRGIETLHVRMDRHAATAAALAGHLASHPGVRAVRYPGLASHPQAEVARRRLRSGGGLLTVDLGTRDAAARFLDALRIPPRTASLGSIQTIAAHPASTTHRQLSDEELATAGIDPGLIRVSVGLEDVEDLRADIDQALTAALAPVAV
ncbi:MAG: aminotransferase class I/II-fold pyridoxal phosphate-dependent enzyme [Chloroflexi bacterium]|nr:aminotransferase class I/II-fold pyridoxal phosphate-dependent enzyme [Chloroflexota bacterium]